MFASRSSGGVVSVNLTSGGSNYASAPTVAFTGGGGTGAAGVAHMAGTMVDSIVITNHGTGYTSSPSVVISAATGSGASAKAYVYSGATRPMSFFQGREGDVYGVDGMGRGIRIACGATSADKLGVEKPAVGPAITAASTYTKQYVAGIQLVRGGAGYFSTPSVVLTGGTPSHAASARAVMRDGRLTGVVMIERGAGYQAPPAVSFSGGFPTGAAFSVGVSGSVRDVAISSAGTGYLSNATTTPTVQFSTAQGLTNALAIPVLDDLGRVASIDILAAGTGATTTGVTALVVGGGGTGAVLAVSMEYQVASVTVTSGGTQYLVPPVLTIVPAADDYVGDGAVVTASVTGQTVSSVTVVNGGLYSAPPTCTITDTQAQAVAVMAPPIRGRYYCAVRYIDESRSGEPIPSSISFLTEVDVPIGADSLTWTFTHSGVDSRVTAMELWRTTADQAVVLYRVATIAKTAGEWTAGYTDTKSDFDLQDSSLPGYGLMPVTLPSGQLNARRFGVTPGNYGVGVLFQDRAWYAVDTTGERPNSLLFSEVDEPESVPAENELLLQESVGEYDSIVSLIPLSTELLVAQTGHLYSLRYVAQPIFDASISLAAYRGVLTNSCWTVMGGVAFLADSYGIYAYDGQKESPISVAVDNYFRDGIVDFSKKDKFHMSSDFNSKVVRFHYCKSGDTDAVRALCYCAATEAWWEEEYATAITASAPAIIANKRAGVFGTGGGAFTKQAAGQDSGAVDVAWKYRTGNLPLNNDPGRSIGFLYTPTAATCNLDLSLHFNGSSAPRANAVASDRGTGFTTLTGGTSASLNLSSTRSALGTASGYAQAMFAGRIDPRSSGADRHVAVAFAGTQGAGEVKVHAVTIEGVA